MSKNMTIKSILIDYAGSGQKCGDFDSGIDKCVDNIKECLNSNFKELFERINREGDLCIHQNRILNVVKKS